MQITQSQYFYEALVSAGVKPEEARRFEQKFESDFKQNQTMILENQTRIENLEQTVVKNDERQRSNAEHITSQLLNELKLMRSEMNGEMKAIYAEMKLMRSEMNSEFKAIRTEMKADKSELKAEVEKVQSSLLKEMILSQRWLVGTIFVAMSLLVALQKFL